MRRFTVVILAGALALTGCSSASKTKAAPPASPAPSLSPTTTAGASEPSGSASPGVGITAVRSQTFPVHDSKTGRVVIGVSAVQVRGKLAVVDVNFAPSYPDKSSDASISLFSLNGDNGLHPHLIDTVNLKRYAVVKDSDGRALGSDDLATSANGGTGTASYTFAAPPPDVMSMDFSFGDFPPFHDVPVSR